MGKPYILLIEDNADDVDLTIRAFEKNHIANEVVVMRDGAQACGFLFDSQRAHTTGWPALILLDLNLPKMDGREVLARIKEDATLKAIPTIILTSSEAEADIVKSYQLHASCYLSKPVRLADFESLVRSINDFWLTRVRFPQRSASA